MSHTTTVSGLSIKFADSIRAAVTEMKTNGLNVELLENATPRMYYPHQMQEVGDCDFVLKVKDAKYDVGLKWNSEAEEYDLIFDEWGGNQNSSFAWDGSIRNAIGIKSKHPEATKIGDSPDWDDNDKRLAHIAGFTTSYNRHLIQSKFTEQGWYDTTMTTTEDGGTTMVANLGMY